MLNQTDGESDDTNPPSPPGSPAPSLYSYNSSVDGRLMTRNVYGRLLNNQNETYFMPADQEEHRRLDLQHYLYTQSLGALYPAADLVRRVLDPKQNFRPAILDVGAGSGRWAIDMAKEFPHSDVVGVDLAPPRVEEPVPTNCRFEIDDANLGFAHFRGCFNVVHARSISTGIRDFPWLINELAAALHPGGVLLLGDGDMQLFDENKRPIALKERGQPGFSWTHSMFFAAYNAMKRRGGNVDSPSMSPAWLRSTESLTDVDWQKIYIPIGPWQCGNDQERLTAELMRTNTLAFISGMVPMLLSEGYLPESIDTMQREAAAELEALTVHLYTRWSFAWAVKRT